MGDRTAPGPPPWGRVCAGHLAFYSGEHAHGEKNTNGLPGGSRWIPARVRPRQTPPKCPGNPGPGKARIFQNGRQGNWTETLRFGRRAARWDGRKIPWDRFLRLLERARLLSRFAEKGAQKTAFGTVPWLFGVHRGGILVPWGHLDFRLFDRPEVIFGRPDRPRATSSGQSVCRDRVCIHRAAGAQERHVFST